MDYIILKIIVYSHVPHGFATSRYKLWSCTKLALQFSIPLGILCKFMGCLVAIPAYVPGHCHLKF